MRFRLPLLITLALLASGLRVRAGDAPTIVIPPVQREFRGVWVATVANIDWPSRPGLSTAEQKTELVQIMERARGLNLNAVVFQVRPACDALYQSDLEPWSEYLTGQQGRAPAPFYDPLQFAIDEAHKRGLELHAWFNPYRARHSGAKSAPAPEHVSRSRPELVRQYGKQLWLDPGDAAVRDYSLDVIMDVVRRYDIDGVHLDDYFYPYKEKDESGQVIAFPDGPSWLKYQRSGGTLSRDDWRRQSVDDFVEKLYREVKKAKRRVKVGISPFGIWRPGYPAQVRGFDAYAELYADSRRWLVNGWVDYFSPQLYWKVASAGQSYPALLKWWSEQNPGKRHLWPGNYTSQVGMGTWPASELVEQVRMTRERPGAGGNIHFSAKPLVHDQNGVAGALEREVYSQPALVPPSPWLDQGPPPGRPDLKVTRVRGDDPAEASWKPEGDEPAWLWVVRTERAGQWTTEVLPGATTLRGLPAGQGRSPISVFSVSAVDRCGVEGPPAVLPLTEKSVRVRMGG